MSIFTKAKGGKESGNKYKIKIKEGEKTVYDCVADDYEWGDSDSTYAYNYDYLIIKQGDRTTRVKLSMTAMVFIEDI